MSRDTNLLDQIAEVREHTDRQHTHTHTQINRFIKHTHIQSVRE